MYAWIIGLETCMHGIKHEVLGLETCMHGIMHEVSKHVCMALCID